MQAKSVAQSAKAQKIPPFLKKLVDLTNACPPQIGSWNEDGTYFVVKSSQFADLLREQFHGTLQTFVRQLQYVKVVLPIVRSTELTHAQLLLL